MNYEREKSKFRTCITHATETCIGKIIFSSPINDPIYEESKSINYNIISSKHILPADRLRVHNNCYGDYMSFYLIISSKRSNFCPTYISVYLLGNV